MGGFVVGFGARWSGDEFVFLWVSLLDLRVLLWFELLSVVNVGVVLCVSMG